MWKNLLCYIDHHFPCCCWAQALCLYWTTFALIIQTLTFNCIIMDFNEFQQEGWYVLVPDEAIRVLLCNSLLHCINALLWLDRIVLCLYSVFGCGEAVAVGDFSVKCYINIARQTAFLLLVFMLTGWKHIFYKA